MCTNAIQVPVKYRKTLSGAVMRSRDITASFNNYEITKCDTYTLLTEVRYKILQRRETTYLALNQMLLINTESK